MSILAERFWHMFGNHSVLESAETVAAHCEEKLSEKVASPSVKRCRTEAEWRGYVLARATEMVEVEAADLLRIDRAEVSERKELVVQTAYELLVDRFLERSETSHGCRHVAKVA